MARARTAAQRAALRKAQLASARKRRKLGTVRHKDGSKTFTYMGDSRGRHRPNTGKHKFTQTIRPASKRRLLTKKRLKTALKVGLFVGAVRFSYSRMGKSYTKAMMGSPHPYGSKRTVARMEVQGRKSATYGMSKADKKAWAKNNIKLRRSKSPEYGGAWLNAMKAGRLK